MKLCAIACLTMLSACSSNRPERIHTTVPEYIPVPGPVEYVKVPAKFLEPCIDPKVDTPVSLGYMKFGMVTGDLLKTVELLWQKELIPCNNQITQIRKLMESQPAKESARQEAPDN